MTLDSLHTTKSMPLFRSSIVRSTWRRRPSPGFSRFAMSAMLPCTKPTFACGAAAAALSVIEMRAAPKSSAATIASTPAPMTRVLYTTRVRSSLPCAPRYAVSGIATSSRDAASRARSGSATARFTATSTSPTRIGPPSSAVCVSTGTWCTVAA